MSTTGELALSREGDAVDTRRWGFAVAAGSVAIASCALAGWAPLGFSIAIVFLFAGPHNWLEARYLLTRMPARWGPLRSFFLLGLLGVPVLTAIFAAMPLLVDMAGSSDRAFQSLEAWNISIAVWNTLLVVWIVALVQLRCRHAPRRDWPWVLPAGLLLIAVNWLWPLHWSLLIVYAHPLVALWFLDRELGRQRPQWQSIYRGCLLLVPGLVALLWLRLAHAPDLPGDDVLTRQITKHAGGGTLAGVSTHFLVSLHTFLEMLHYGVWVLAIPLISIRTAPWRLSGVPLARKSLSWRRVVIGALCLGLAIVVLLWAALLADYPLARNIYFTVAMLHVLAEVPFLLRLL